MSGLHARRGKRRRALLLIAALAVPTAIGYPSAHGQPNPAQQCRAATPAAQAILPVVQSNHAAGRPRLGQWVPDPAQRRRNLGHVLPHLPVARRLLGNHVPVELQ